MICINYELSTITIVAVVKVRIFFSRNRNTVSACLHSESEPIFRNKFQIWAHLFKIFFLFEMLHFVKINFPFLFVIETKIWMAVTSSKQMFTWYMNVIERKISKDRHNIRLLLARNSMLDLRLFPHDTLWKRMWGRK